MTTDVATRQAEVLDLAPALHALIQDRRLDVGAAALGMALVRLVEAFPEAKGLVLNVVAATRTDIELLPDHLDLTIH